MPHSAIFDEGKYAQIGIEKTLTNKILMNLWLEPHALARYSQPAIFHVYSQSAFLVSINSQPCEIITETMVPIEATILVT